MIDSLQEGFFVGDADGRIVEINAAFTELLGYGADGLPYAQPFPWLPAADTDPEGHRLVLDALARAKAEPTGSFVLPMRHRDGHRVWAATAYNELNDDEGRRRLVGTIRDVTAERYAVQREAALAAMNQRLTGESGVPAVLGAAVDLLRDLWRADRVLAVTWPRIGEPGLTSTDPGDRRWADLDSSVRATLDRIRSLPALHAATAGAAAGTTLDHPDGQLTLWVEPAAGRPLGTEDQTLLALLAGTLAHALRRAHRDDRQREVALALQRSILGPARLPEGFAVRYEPATPPLEVGGDWYDVITLDDDRIGIVVGDCVGRGLPAAAVMGQLRSACRALLLEASSPSHTLTALDRFAAQVPDALCTTVFCGVLDPATGTLTYSSAGHPPATLIHPDGTAESLDAGGSVPLAVRVPGARPEATAVVPIGSLLMLYTDGLVERRRESLDDGIDRATGVAHRAHDAELADLASTLMTAAPGRRLRGRRRPAALPPDRAAADDGVRGAPGQPRRDPALAAGVAGHRGARPGPRAGRAGRRGRGLRERGRTRLRGRRRREPAPVREPQRRPAGRDDHRPRPLEAATAGQPRAARARHADDEGAGRRGHRPPRP